MQVGSDNNKWLDITFYIINMILKVNDDKRYNNKKYNNKIILYIYIFIYFNSLIWIKNKI